MSDEKERGVIFTPKIEEEGRIDELPTVDTNDSSILTPEEIAKFSPAPEENTEELPSEEPKELTEEEKKELFIKQLKESKIKFRPIKHYAVKSTTVVTEELDVLGRRKKRIDRTILTNVTTNKFGKAYHDKRRRKNKMQKASRKASR
jgi:hypothetical protein